MATSVDMSKVVTPADKYEQIEGSIRFILDNDKHYEALGNTPRRLEAAAVKMFMEEWTGYHAIVIRAAMRELDITDKIVNGPVYID